MLTVSDYHVPDSTHFDGGIWKQYKTSKLFYRRQMESVLSKTKKQQDILVH